MGYRTFFARPLDKAKRAAKRTMVTGPQSMANEFLEVASCLGAGDCFLGAIGDETAVGA